MNDKIKSEGKCLYCNKLMSIGTIGTHLAKHLDEIEKNTTERTKPYNHIVIHGKYNKDMFLQLVVDSNVELEEIDDFLRSIWLECCGHMSSFSVERDEIDMNEKVGSAFLSKKQLTYDYDFGTTTTLIVKALKIYNLPFDEEIILLSRNEPLKIMCNICDKEPAVAMCQSCYGDYGLLAFCKKCAKKHSKTCDDFAEYAEVAIVNSPRCGECGYEGGSIDLDRDGIYKT